MGLDPIAFGVFGGHYNGWLVFRLSDTPDVALRATLTGVDVAAATRFAGSPGTISGTLSGRLNIAGRGLTAASLLQSAHGGARLDIVNGVVNNLGLVRSIVVATSGRGDAGGGNGHRDEPFSRLGTTLTIGGGSARTTDLRFESPDLFSAQPARCVSTAATSISPVAHSCRKTCRGRPGAIWSATRRRAAASRCRSGTGSAAAPHVRIDSPTPRSARWSTAPTRKARKRSRKGSTRCIKR